MAREETYRMVPVPGLDTKPDGPILKQVARPTLTVSNRLSLYDYTPEQQPGLRKRLQRRALACCSCSSRRLWGAVRARLPILDWLPAYRIRQDLIKDITAGVTIGVMHIPLGIGFALLAGLAPINGLYMAFFPALVYVLVGTSCHVSMGPFPVTCMMMEKLVTKLSSKNSHIAARSGQADNETIMNVFNASSHSLDFSNTTDIPAVAISYTPQQVAAALALTVAIWEMLMGVFQLGPVFSAILSKMLISGFTTSAAVHVLTSQLKALLGISVPRHAGPFKAIYTYRDLCLGLPTVNTTVLIMSAVCIIVLMVNDSILKPRLKKVSSIPLPMELIVVAAVTTASYFLNLEENHHVTVVGHVPTGLPTPSVPPLELLPPSIVDGLLIAVISFTITYSIAKMFAQKHGYTTDATQELYAQGLSNAFGSLFSCGPVSTAMSRSLILEGVGVASQLAAVFSCAFVLLVLFFIGPLFESLPLCVLSSIVVVSLKGLLLQVTELPKLWSSSRLDAVVWLVAFVVGVVVDLDYGLLAGVLASALVLLLRAQHPPALHLGYVPFTDLYLDLARYNKAVEVPGVKIFQFGGPLHFCNASYFQSSLFSVTGLDLAAIRTATASTITKSSPSDNQHPKEDVEQNGVNHKEDSKACMNGDAAKDHTCFTLSVPRWLVLDLSLVSFTDTAGANLLVQLHRELKSAGVTLCLASVSDRALDTLEKSGVFEDINRDLTFHSTHDAVTFITSPIVSSHL